MVIYSHASVFPELESSELVFKLFPVFKDLK